MQAAIDPAEPAGPTEQVAPMWGSDAMAAVLRTTGVPYFVFNPGASYRGLHDSLVNVLGAHDPAMLMCLHEEHAVAIAHGWAKGDRNATGDRHGSTARPDPPGLPWTAPRAV